MTARYSAEIESYVEKVVAVKGEWPARVERLRNAYPGNELAFKTALEKLVIAEYERSRGQQAIQQQQQQQRQQQHQSSNQDGNANGVGKSYPGQQSAPATSTPNNANASSNPSSSMYIPYAREQRVNPPTSSASRRTAPSTATGIPQSSANAGPSSTTSATPTATTLRTAQPRTGSSLNPANNYSSNSSTAGPAVAAAAAAASMRSARLPPPQPVTSSKLPLPPFFPISIGQAYMTTYPSRLRLGLTNLMQPITASGQVISAQSVVSSSQAKENAAAAAAKGDVASHVSTATPSTLLGKRQRSRVNYTEPGLIPDEARSSSSDDEDGQDEQMSQQQLEEEQKMSRAARAAKRGSGWQTPNFKDTPTSGVHTPVTAKEEKEKSSSAKKLKDDVGGGGKSYLGLDPPGDLILVQPARRHFLPYISEQESQSRAQLRSLIIPIRIDFDTDAHRIRDVFLWDLTERTITPEIFAKIMCLDLDIPYEPFGLQMAGSIKAQIAEHTGTAEVALLSPEQEVEGAEADLRVVVNIDVQIGTLHLVDRVEWDLTSSLTPEAFATTLASDLGLGAEAVSLVAHSIHEELLRLKRECLEQGFIGRAAPDGSTAVSVSRDANRPRKLESVWRDWNDAASFGPRVEILSPEEADALEQEKAVNPRRAKPNSLAAEQAKWAQNGRREAAGRRRL